MSTTLEYKNYNGTVEFSAEDRVLHGTISGIRDNISFEGESVASLEANFQGAVDEYLAFCAAEGKTPDLPYKGSFNVRVTPDLHKRAALYAAEHHKNLNKVVMEALDKYLVGIGGNTGYAKQDVHEVTGQTAIPIVEEEVFMGKREVDRGGVRAHSHVVETPVQAQFDLHEERVNVTRRAVDLQAASADFEVGNRSSFELRATGEEAVVGKASRVVEEVLVGKRGSDRTETVSDSVRRTEVEVEQIPGKFATS